jgi:hypothetical protein
VARGVTAYGTDCAFHRFTTETTMTDPADSDEAETQEQRALKHISAIADGADITEHASDLSNEFTDRFMARIVEWLTRRKHR